MYLNDACTLPVNIAGLPGISVPCGLSDGLPVGLQVIGRAFDEATVLRVADAYERAAGFADLRPALGRRRAARLPMPEISHVRVAVPNQATLNRILREGGAQRFPQWLYAEPGDEARILWWGVRSATPQFLGVPEPMIRATASSRALIDDWTDPPRAASSW